MPFDFSIASLSMILILCLLNCFITVGITTAEYAGKVVMLDQAPATSGNSVILNGRSGVLLGFGWNILYIMAPSIISFILILAYTYYITSSHY